VTAFDRDGWEVKSGHWAEGLAQSLEQASLAQFLMEIANLPPEEATTIATTSLARWRDVGDLDLDRRAWRRAVPTLGLLILIPVVGLVLLGVAIFLIASH
jgi:hypothetical protein